MVAENTPHSVWDEDWMWLPKALNTHLTLAWQKLAKGETDGVLGILDTMGQLTKDNEDESLRQIPPVYWPFVGILTLGIYHYTHLAYMAVKWDPSDEAMTKDMADASARGADALDKIPREHRMPVLVWLASVRKWNQRMREAARSQGG